MNLKQTHTFVDLELSAQAFAEIKAKLLAAGYEHAIDEREQRIHMHGLAVVAERVDERFVHTETCDSCRCACSRQYEGEMPGSFLCFACKYAEDPDEQPGYGNAP